MNFASKIDKLLKDKNIKNLRQLAIELDIPYTTLWDYYSNPIRLEKANLTYIKKIAKHLGCTIDYLAYDDITEINGVKLDGFDLGKSIDENFLRENISFLIEKGKIPVNKLLMKLNITMACLKKLLNEEIILPNELVEKIAKIYGFSVKTLTTKNLKNYNLSFINTKGIPVYGTIKAGLPIESQSDIIDYVEIPVEWLKGEKKFFGIKISGDSMFPKYLDGDTVIFEQTNDIELYNGKDVAVMINNSESTFKKLIINEQGIILQPYNTAYDIMMFSKEQIEQLPIKIVGLAKEIRRKI